MRQLQNWLETQAGKKDVRREIKTNIGEERKSILKEGTGRKQRWSRRTKQREEESKSHSSCIFPAVRTLLEKLKTVAFPNLPSPARSVFSV